MHFLGRVLTRYNQYYAACTLGGLLACVSIIQEERMGRIFMST